MKINKHELLKTVGYLGAALLAAGAIRYQIEGALRTFSQALLIAGGVMVLLSLALNFGAVRAYFARRSTRLGANTLVLAASVVAILVVANVLGYRYHKRFDLTAEKLYSLSDQTRQVLGKLDRDVLILEFDKSSNRALAELVAEYRASSRRISYQRIDPQERPDLAQQHKITREGEVVLVREERTERLAEFTEQALTNTILKVTRDALKTVCFTEGHGEKQLDSAEAAGYRAVAEGLRNENYQVRGVNLIREAQVPAECAVVVAAGPQQAFFAPEVELLEDWLEAGGKLMLLLDPDTKPQLDPLLAAWNIKLGDNVVIDASGLGRIFGTGPAVPLVGDYGAHPITERFAGTATFFPLARTVDIADEEQFTPRVTELLRTSERSWAETELRGTSAQFTEGRDTPGPLSLGVAASKDAGEAEDDKQARLVVIGDSDFATNRYAGLQRNGDLFFNAVNWLAEEEDLISVRPKTATNRRVTLTEAEQRLLFWFTLVLLPGAVVVAGVYIWWKRR